MVKDHSDSKRGNPLPPHMLLLSINSKGSFICTIPQTITHTTAFVTPVVEHWVEREIAQLDIQMQGSRLQVSLGPSMFPLKMLHGPLLLVGPCFWWAPALGGSLGFSLVSLMDNGKLKECSINLTQVIILLIVDSVAKSSANGLVGTGFISQYRL